MATQAKRDYYEILSVSRTATEQEIKSSYRKLAMQYHPDRNPGNTEAEEKFKECTEAYSVLMDAEKRARYDQYGHSGVSAGDGFGGFDPYSVNINDFINSFVNDFLGGNGGRRSGSQEGEDLRVGLTLTFEEAVFGCKKQVSLRRYETCAECKGSGAGPKGSAKCSTCRGQGQVIFQRGFVRISQPCPHCQGLGTVITDPCGRCKGEGQVVREQTTEMEIPAGVYDGLKYSYRGQGHAGVNGGPAGDLYVVIKVKPHAFFEREGRDLHCSVPISFAQAALGDELTIPTLDGSEHKLKVPEGTQSGTTFRIRGKGVPALQSHGKGDLYVHVRVQTPSKLTKKQRELLAELGGTFSVENKPEPRSLFEKVKDIFG